MGCTPVFGCRIGNREILCLFQVGDDLVVNIFFWFTQDVVRFRDADLFQYQRHIAVDTDQVEIHQGTDKLAFQFIPVCQFSIDFDPVDTS